MKGLCFILFFTLSLNLNAQYRGKGGYFKVVATYDRNGYQIDTDNSLRKILVTNLPSISGGNLLGVSVYNPFTAMYADTIMYYYSCIQNGWYVYYTDIPLFGRDYLLISLNHHRLRLKKSYNNGSYSDYKYLGEKDIEIDEIPTN